MKKVSMDPAAIEARLRQVSQLRDLCVALGKGRPMQEKDLNVKRTGSHETDEKQEW